MRPLVRQAKRSDCVGITEVFHAVWHETQLPLQDPGAASEYTIPLIDQRVMGFFDSTVVALRDNRIVGFAQWNRNELERLYLASNARNTGIGKKLLRNAEKRMAASGTKRARLVVIYGNEPALKFYSLAGWKCDEVSRVGSTWLWRMSKLLMIAG